MQRLHSTSRRRWLGCALLVAAFATRLLFWQATPDRGWPHSVYFKGDAVSWTEYAAALAADRPFELGLPLRPPGNAYLLRALGVDGPRGLPTAQIAWCLLGAVTVVLFFHAAATAFGLVVGLVVGLWCAFSNPLLILSTSLNNETPYLAIVGVLVVLFPRLGSGGDGLGAFVLWGLLNGLGCLFRVEHLLFFLLATGWWIVRHRPSGASRRRRLAALAATGAAFAALLAPWHLHAWAAVDRFNNEERALDPAGEAAQRAVENATRGLVWTEGARSARDRLPAFTRRSAGNFVAATVLVRGGRRVEEGDLAILEEAFGSRPRRLARFPFVALYGPLNFYLAQRPGAPPGFDVAGLDRPPRLAGGIGRYPRALLGGLPPPRLNFDYPPHVELVNDGYRLGWRAIRRAPGTAARRALARLDVLLHGAAGGWTGYGAPWGIAGPRRAVDLVVPEGWACGIWRLALLPICAAGLWVGRRSPALAPWLAFATMKIAATLLFFGYARHGAALVPLLAVLVGLVLRELVGIERLGPRRLVAAAGIVAALALGTEAVRWARPPDLALDGRSIGRGDPFPPGEHRDRELTVEVVEP